MRKKKEDRNPKIVIDMNGHPCIALWRERMALEIYKDLLNECYPFKNVSYMAVGREMVKRGYTKDTRYLSKRLWFLEHRKKQ